MPAAQNRRIMLTGIIIKGIGGFYYVKTDEGLIECRARGLFRKEGEKPMVGDKVQIRRTAEDKTKGSVEEILPRKNALIRPPVANIDQLLITVASTNPAPNLRLIDQLTVTAEALGIQPVICINKVDLDLETANHIASIYEKAGYVVLLTSAREAMGLETLKKVLQNKITALAGNSGVGKSSLLNRLCQTFGLETGAVSEKTKRGKHTTRHIELFELPFGGYVFDTPGFSSYETEGLLAGELAGLFPEIKRAEGNCRFTGCAHIKEPECSVKAALEAGDIAKERYESYCALYQEIKNNKTWK